MMTTNQNNSGKGHLGNRGFSLIELMVVVAILGALGAAVGVYINNDDARLRSFAFNLGSRFKQAKFEAMKRGHDVYLSMNLALKTCTIWVDNNDNTVYNAWVDVDPPGPVPANGVCDEDEGDCLIGEIITFPDGVEIYDASVATITGGPKDPGGGSNDNDIDDGLTASADRFLFEPSGEGKAGALYLYYSRNVAGGKEVSSGPLAIVVNAVGRIVIDEWQSGKTGGAAAIKWRKDNP